MMESNFQLRMRQRDKGKETFLSTDSLSMPLGIKLRVNMSHESSKLENVIFQLIPVSSIKHNHTRTSSPRLFRDI